MAAFQQRRQAPPRASQLYDDPSDDTLAASLASTAASDEGVLLFNPPASSLAESSWAVVPPPGVGRAGRTISFDSSASTVSRSTASTGDSLSPNEGTTLLLAPSHGGDGVFAGDDNHDRTAHDSLHLHPSVYAAPWPQDDDCASSAFASPSLASTASLPFSTAHLRRPSVQSTLSYGSDARSLDSAGWALTEENLAASLTSHQRHVDSNSARNYADADDDHASPGFTSGSDDAHELDVAGDDPHATVRRGRRAQRLAAREREQRRAQLRRFEEETDWALSVAALSSGIRPARAADPRSSSRRRPPPSSSSSLARALAASSTTTNKMRTPSSASAASATGSGSASSSVARYKRRHRRAGGSSQKRSASGQAYERLFKEEEERAVRMSEVLRAREGEARERERVRSEVEGVVFGRAVLSYLHIPPSTLSLLDTLPASSSALPTPTPSRTASPSRLHGLSRFAASAEVDLRASGFDLAAFDGADVSDVETEHPGAEEDGEEHWMRYEVPSAGAGGLNAAQRSRSASSLPALAMGSNALGLSALEPARPSQSATLRPPKPALRMRRSSSFAGLASLPPSASASSAPTAALSHEERILLAPPSTSTPSREGEGEADGEEGSAWGGDFESLEIALGYWKRLLRRLRILGADGVAEAEGEGVEGVVGERSTDTVPIIPVYA
ncbi:hypothetical protein JCM10207_005034 [Rhodosporidiobolus poonsookiae]